MKQGFSPDFLAWYINSPFGRAWIASVVSQQVGQANVNGTKLKNLRVPVPSLHEQQRIVAEIEKQLTRLEAGLTALKRIEANVARYRQAALASAFSDTWPASPVDDVVQIIDYRGRTPPFADQGVPHLRSSNIRNGRISWDGLAYVTNETYTQFMTRGLPREGDVLFTTEAPLGEVALAPGEKFSVAQRIMILRPKVTDLTAKFLRLFLMTSEFQSQLRRSGTGSFLRVNGGDSVEFIVNDRGEVIVRAVGRDVRKLRGLLARSGRRAVTVEEMNEAILRHHARKH